MTLYERMKPSIREKLDDSKQEYPNTHEWLVGELKKTDFFTDLKYGDVIMLQDTVGTDIHFMFEEAKK